MNEADNIGGLGCFGLITLISVWAALLYTAATLFPTGRPLSRRWGWLVWVGVLLMLFLLAIVTFGTAMQPGSGGADWSYPNPLGLISNQEINESVVLTSFTAFMPVWVVLCLAALVVRYGQEERKWSKRIDKKPCNHFPSIAK